MPWMPAIYIPLVRVEVTIPYLSLNDLKLPTRRAPSKKLIAPIPTIFVFTMLSANEIVLIRN